MTTEIEPEGLGYYGSFDDLRKTVGERLREGRNTFGWAEIFLGATIVTDGRGAQRIQEPWQGERINVLVNRNGVMIPQEEPDF